VLPRYRDTLDAILKTGAVTLPVPAILIGSYLRLIGHTELFAASILSLSGLSAFLQAFLLLLGVFLLCIVTPSAMIYWFLGGPSSARPSRGLPNYILLSSFLIATLYFVAFEWPTGHAAIITSAALALSILLTWLAWKSPRWLEVIPRERWDDHWHFPAWITPDARKHPSWDSIVSFFRKKRLFRAFTFMFVMAIAGIFSTEAIVVVYHFSFNLPDHGWKAVCVLFCIVIASLWPSAFYFKARVSGHSEWGAIRIAILFVVATFTIVCMNGFSLVPLIFGTMNGMGIIDNEPQTYQVLNVDDRPLFNELGYKQKAGEEFVEGYVRFQFADVKLVCPTKFDLASRLTNVVSNANRPSNLKAAPASTATNKKTSLGTSGCVVVTKEEMRVVDLPSNFRKSPPAVVPVDKAPVDSHKGSSRRAG